jgi:DNA-binding winged helix-turn-helix (wHTH) protein
MSARVRRTAESEGFKFDRPAIASGGAPSIRRRRAEPPPDGETGQIAIFIGESAPDLSVVNGTLGDGRTVLLIPSIDLAERWMHTLRSGRGDDTPTDPQDDFHLGPLEIGIQEHRVLWRGRPLAVSEQEWRILTCLASQPEQAWSFRDLLKAVWGTDYGTDLSLVHCAIKRLRQKLVRAGVNIEVESVRGFGFRMSTSRSLLR